MVARQQMPRRRGGAGSDQVVALPRVRTAVDHVAEHYHQVGAPPIHVGQHRLQRRQVGVDVGHQGQLHARVRRRPPAAPRPLGSGALGSTYRCAGSRAALPSPWHQILPVCLISVASLR